MRVTSKGQVTIPQDLRREFGIGPGTDVVFEGRDGVLTVRKAPGPSTRGTRLVEHLRGRGDVAMSTDEIMALTRDQ